MSVDGPFHPPWPAKRRLTQPARCEQPGFFFLPQFFLSPPFCLDRFSRPVVYDCNLSAGIWEQGEFSWLKGFLIFCFLASSAVSFQTTPLRIDCLTTSSASRVLRGINEACSAFLFFQLAAFALSTSNKIPLSESIATTHTYTPHRRSMRLSCFSTIQTVLSVLRRSSHLIPKNQVCQQPNHFR